jgi:hypothetical protein
LHSQLEITRKIGVGSFGEVLLANFRGTKVAVKRMRGFEMSADNDEPGPSPTMMPVFAEVKQRADILYSYYELFPREWACTFAHNVSGQPSATAAWQRVGTS